MIVIAADIVRKAPSTTSIPCSSFRAGVPDGMFWHCFRNCWTPAGVGVVLHARGREKHAFFGILATASHGG